MSSLSFDDLFALRIELSDDFQDEHIIIKELKMILLRNGLNNMNEVNNYLVEFYNTFGINMDLETIENINIQIIPSLNIINQLINQTFVNANLSNNINLPNVNNIINQTFENDSDDDISENDSDDDISENDSDDDISENNSNNYNLNHQQNSLIVNQPPSVISINQFMNSFNELINTFENLQPPPPQPMEDVKVTLKNEKTIKKYKLDNDLDEKCTVCLCPLKKDDMIWELKCKHVFHQDCIKTWLKEYNYKCPICREEAGEGETDI